LPAWSLTLRTSASARYSKGATIGDALVPVEVAAGDPQDQEEDTRAIRALNDRLLGDQRVTLSLVPIGDGLTLARKR
jgi:predicted O-methyltransferase YrrM